MDWTSLIGPAVVAAVIASIVSVVGFLINRSTVRGMHAERLAFDREQAERRTKAEITLMEHKGASDISLTEKKVLLDRALASWKRRTELAEEVLAGFYQARDIIQAARSPGSYSGEGSTRPKTDWETEGDQGTLNAYFASTERLLANAEFFAQLQARRYQFLALFGSDATKHFDEIFQIKHEINVGVMMLISWHRHAKLGGKIDGREKMEARIWSMGDTDDLLLTRLNNAVSGIEVICEPVLSETSNL